MIEMLPTEAEEIGFGGDAADGMQELRTDPLPDEVGVFLDLLGPLGIRNARVADRLIEFVNIRQDIPASRESECFACKMLSDLGKDPRIAHGTPADHQAACARRTENGLRLGGSGDIPVGEDRAGE